MRDILIKYAQIDHLAAIPPKYITNIIIPYLTPISILVIYSLTA